MTTKKPIDLTAKSIAKFFERDRTGAVIPDAALQAVHDAVASVEASADQIASMFDAVMQDSSRTEGQRLIEAKKGVERIANAAGAKLDAAADRIKTELAAIDRATSAPPPMDAQAIQIASDIRRALAGMSAKDRSDRIAAAIAGDDDTTMRAVLGAPAWISGMTNLEVSARRHAWALRKHPKEMERAARLKKAQAALERNGTSFVSFVAGLAQSPAATLAAAAAERAEAARAAATTE